MQNKHPLQDLIEPIVEDKGFELVRLLTIGAKNPTLQVMIDRLDGEDIVVDDCAVVSRAISAVLDEQDPIRDQYTLEVSSPGLDRPLTKLSHFERFIGWDAKIETSSPVENRKRFKGIIKDIDSTQNIILEVEGTDYAIPFDIVSKAKLVLTDDMLQGVADAEEIEL